MEVDAAPIFHVYVGALHLVLAKPRIQSGTFSLIDVHAYLLTLHFVRAAPLVAM